MRSQHMLFVLLVVAIAGAAVGGLLYCNVANDSSPGELATKKAAKELAKILQDHKVSAIHLTGTASNGTRFRLDVGDKLVQLLASSFVESMKQDMGVDPNPHPLGYRIVFVVEITDDEESSHEEFFIAGVSKSVGVVGPFPSDRLWLYGQNELIYAVCEATYLIARDSELTDMEKARARDAIRWLRDSLKVLGHDDQVVVQDLIAELQVVS